MRTIFIILLFASFTVAGQTISPSPGDYTTCPGEDMSYSVIPGTNYPGCTTFVWTVTNGTFNSSSSSTTTITTQSANTIVHVFWKDTPGKGTLTVVATGCNNEATFTKSSEYAIRSLKGRTPANPWASHTLPYCSESSFTIQVDEMFLENTGGTTGITQQYADGYEWDLPPGWKSNGNSGTVTSASRIITITPDNGCAGGTVKVRAYKNCDSKKYSEYASIPVNRPTPNLTVTPQAGYNGPSCGKVDPVTFTVTPISCAASYTWVFNGPNPTTSTGWLTYNTATSEWIPITSPVQTAENYLTVTPSGGEADGGSIQVTANLDCQTQIKATTYSMNFTKPAINVESAICHDGTDVSLSNVASGISVNWSVSNNMNILSGQGTSNVVIGANTQFLRETGTIDVTVSCPNTTVPQKIVWLGRPYEFLVEGPTLVAAGSYHTYNAKKWNSQTPTFSEQGITINDFSWSFGWPATSAGWNCFGCSGEYVSIQAGASSTYVTATVENSCGTATRNYEVFVEQVNCPPGGCEEPFFIYPNPSTEELTIQTNPASVENNTGYSEILLVDSNGNIVYKSKERDKKQTKIPLHAYKNGIYYVIISKEGVTTKRQIIVAH